MSKPKFTLLHFPDAKQMTYEEAFEIIKDYITDPETAQETQDEIMDMLIEYFDAFEDDYICGMIAQKLTDLRAILEYFWSLS